eukprot:gene31130-40481_t
MLGIRYHKKVYNAKAIAKVVFRRVPYYRVFDGFPYLYINPQTNQRAVICFCEKVGSTAWKTLLLKSFNDSNFLSTSAHIGEYKNNSTPKITRDIYEAALTDPETPKIMFIRNPYSRLLSGFGDKVYNITDANLRRKYFKGFKAKDKTFANFVKYVRDVHERDIHPNNSKPPFLNPHYMLQSEKCFIPQGMRYHYYLKVEHTPVWYPFALKLLGLESVASSGWDVDNTFRNIKMNSTALSLTNSTADMIEHSTTASSPSSATTITTTITTTTTSTTTSTTVSSVSSTNTVVTNTTTVNTKTTVMDNSNEEAPTCFYSPPGFPCKKLHTGGSDGGLSYSTQCIANDTRYAYLQSYNITLETMIDEDSFVGRSIAAMKEMYTPEIVSDATSFVERDLLMFGYAYWDGGDIMQYIKDLIYMRTGPNCTDLSLYYS